MNRDPGPMPSPTPNRPISAPGAAATVRHSARIQRTKLPGRWRWQLKLDDDRILWQRPIDPADAEPIRQTFPLLSPEEIRLRFLHPVKELTPAQVQQLTRIDPATQFALVIAEPLPAGEALVGAVARLAITTDTRQAEFAILVSRFVAGHGLGRLLMQQLIQWARRKRLDSIYGDILDENHIMLKLVDSLGFRRERSDDEPGVIRVRLNLVSAQRDNGATSTQ